MGWFSSRVRTVSFWLAILAIVPVSLPSLSLAATRVPADAAVSQPVAPTSARYASPAGSHRFHAAPSAVPSEVVTLPEEERDDDLTKAALVVSLECRSEVADSRERPALLPPVNRVIVLKRLTI